MKRSPHRRRPTGARQPQRDTALARRRRVARLIRDFNELLGDGARFRLVDGSRKGRPVRGGSSEIYYDVGPDGCPEHKLAVRFPFTVVLTEAEHKTLWRAFLGHKQETLSLDELPASIRRRLAL